MADMPNPRIADRKRDMSDKHYWVIGLPTHSYMGDGHYIEDGREVACVAAPTATAAKWAALKTPEFKGHRGDVAPQHPLTDMEAKDARCPHGVCFCDGFTHPDQPDEWCAGCCADEGHRIDDYMPKGTRCWCGAVTKDTAASFGEFGKPAGCYIRTGDE